MPSTDAFDKQDAAYRKFVLPPDVTARIAIEAGIVDFWYKYVGFDGRIIGMTTFGESAPAGELFKLFGFTTENVVKTAHELLKLTSIMTCTVPTLRARKLESVLGG